VTAAELTLLEQWNGVTQLLPWVALLATVIGIVLLAVGPSRATAWVARARKAIALVLAGIGVLEHVISNDDAGVPDDHFTGTWPTMSALERW
jgi:hypothetical protein